ARAFRDTARLLPLWLWRLMAWLQSLFGGGRQPKEEGVRRAEALIARLEETERDCVLVCPISFVRVLLDRLRIHSYCINRGGVIRLRPLERILITRRDMHCGGCSHNCFLSNPGCGVGRDKAARQRR
ncbi:MAG: hypothetical protein IJ594_09370, partial [Oscillospiraceae bacterium]|nr:hypothetical protein [Oscillospiraceae bacterium]